MHKELSTDNSEGKRTVLLKGEQFYRAISHEDESYLIGGTCRECGEVFFPSRPVCPVCVKEDTIEDTRLSRRGKIYSYSVLHTPLPGFRAPYMIGRIELPEGTRIVSLIKGCDPVEGAIAIGDEVEFHVGKIAEDEHGNDVIGYMFRPVKVGERGQIVIPLEARKRFDINPGDLLMVFGDLNKGIAISKVEGLKKYALK